MSTEAQALAEADGPDDPERKVSSQSGDSEQKASSSIPDYVIIGSVMLFGVAAYFYWRYCADAKLPRGELSSVVLLMSLPLAQVVILHHALKPVTRWLYTFLAAVGCGVCMFCWALYSAEIYLKGLEYLPLGAAFLGLVGVLWLTRDMVTDGAGTWSEGLKAGRFGALCFFSALFVAITYLFGFALGFHDQYERESSDRAALFSSSRFTFEPAKEDANSSEEERANGVAKSDEGSRITNALPTPRGEGTPTETSFFQSWQGADKWLMVFAEASAEVESENTCGIEMQNQPYCGSEALRCRRMVNGCVLSQVPERVALASKKGPVAVRLRGHATEKKLSDNADYRSNWELSAARVAHVQNELMKRVSDAGGEWANIYWHPWPMSSDSSLLRDYFEEGLVGVKELVDVTEKRSVEVVVEEMDGRALLDSIAMRVHPPGKQLSLLDYLYFSIYTITTTGYGDIVPLSPFAKFVSSLANLVEVLFLVVFFNVLVSRNSAEAPVANQGDPRSTSEAPAGA